MNLRDWNIINTYERALQHRTSVGELRGKLIGMPEPIHALTRVEKLDREAIRLAHRIATGADRTQAYRSQNVNLVDANKTPPPTLYTPPEAIEVGVHMAQLTAQLFPVTPVPYHIVLFHAAQLHAMFLCIHPFTDGNGRTARLLEKWYLSRHLGQWAWNIDTERYYQANRIEYVNNLHMIGNTWDRLQWHRVVPFALMLPAAIEHHLHRADA